jgi:hypothetical protein
MRLSQKSDRSGTKPSAVYYRDKAGTMRELAGRTQFPDTREQLLWIASQYEQLAEHAKDEPEEARPAPPASETAARKE